MKSAMSSCASAGLKRRSKPIVVDAFELIAFPHSEPATCPGYTSTPSPSSTSRRSEWKRPSAPSRASTARSGRAASPTKSESPVRTIHGSSPRVRSLTARQQCSGLWPGVWMQRRRMSPSAISVPSGIGSLRVLGVGCRMDAHWDAVLEREPPVSGEVVGVRVRLDRADDADVALRGLLEVLLDREGRIDDDRVTGTGIADEVGGAAERVVDELREDHGRARPYHRLPLFLLKCRREAPARPRVPGGRPGFGISGANAGPGRPTRGRAHWIDQQQSSPQQSSPSQHEMTSAIAPPFIEERRSGRVGARLTIVNENLAGSSIPLLRA